MSTTTIEQLYISYFGRAADPAGLNYWLGQEAAGISDAAIAGSFAVQLETTQLYPALATPALLAQSAGAQANFINAIYQNLFGHAADAAGLSSWQGQLSGTPATATTPAVAPASAGFMINQIILGAQGTDSTAIASKATAATAYTNAILTASPTVTWNAGVDTAQSRSILATVTTAATATAASSAIAAAIVNDQTGTTGTAGVTLTLPAGGTAVVVSPTQTNSSLQTTANNDTIRAVGNGDLTSAITINGGAGFDTLNALIGGNASINPSLTSVEAVNLDLTASTTFNATGDTGLQIVSAAGGLLGGTGNTLLLQGLSQTTQVGMSDATGISNFVMASFTGINASGNSATLVLNGNNAGFFDSSLSSGNGINTYNIQSIGKTNTVNIWTTDTQLSTINITGSTAINLTNFDTSVTAINGSTATGNQSIVLGAALAGKATITGGSGNNSLNAAAATKAVTLVDGNGTDTLIFNGAIAGNTITVGTGSNLVQTGGVTGLTYYSASDASSTSAITTDVDQLNGYVAGSTKIDLTGLAATGAIDTTINQTALLNALTAVGANNLAGAVNAVAKLVAAQALTKAQVVTFSYGSNAYIYQDNSWNNTSATAGDGLLQINGAAATFKSSDLTIA